MHLAASCAFFWRTHGSDFAMSCIFRMRLL